MADPLENGLAEPEWVEFYLDPLCPWAYHASKWIREVRRIRGVEVRWRFFSLEEINHVAGKKHAWEREWTYGWSLMRVGAYLRRIDVELLDRWYSVVGRALHEEGRKAHSRDVAQELVVEAGLPSDAVDRALADETTQEEVRAEHENAVSAGVFGVPTLIFPDGRSVFGPKIAPAPTGEEALRLWRLTLEWLSFEHLWEMKRPQSGNDMAGIARVLQPYLSVRDWKTVEHPAPGA